MIVLDASIAVKWFLAEPLSGAAASLFTQNRKLLAPSILRNEVTAAIAKAARLDRVTAEEAHAMISRWVRMLDKHAVSLMDTGEQFDDAVRLCIELRHPFHDCFYLAIAQKLSLPLATTDKRLSEQAEKIGVELFAIA
jgi:predicted nucleic acid-binding protein